MKSLLLFVVLLTGCTSQQPSLYDDLGGMEGIERINGRFIYLIGESEQIRPFFLNSNLDRFHRQISDHVCHLAGGPCEYNGDSMMRTHIGMNISESDFNAVVDLMIEAMDGEDIPHRVQNRLLQRLAPLREQIIYQ